MMCFMPDYMSAVCPTFPIKLIKTVRLRVRNTEQLLADKDLNLKVYEGPGFQSCSSKTVFSRDPASLKLFGVSAL